VTLSYFLKRTDVRLFLLGVAVRLLFVALFPGINYYDGITKEYLNCVNNLIHGHGLNVLVDIAPWSSGRVEYAYQPFIGRPVGYVLFCAAISFATGIVPVVIQIVQAIVTGFSVILVYKLSLELFRSLPQRFTIAKFAALLAAVWPNQARFEIALLPDGLTTLITLWLALELVRAIRSPRWSGWVRIGLILALSIFLRPDLVLFPAFLFVLLLLSVPFSRAIKATAIVVAILGIAVGINTWKNYALSGETVPLNLGSGTTMYEGISQFGDTLGTTYADERLAHNIFNTKDLFYPHGVENDRMVWRIAIDTIKHHPGYYATVVLRRIPLLFTVRGLYFSDTVSLSNPQNDLSKRFPEKYIAMLKEHPLQASVRFLSPLLGWLLVIIAFVGIIKVFRLPLLKKEGQNSRSEFEGWSRGHGMIALLLFYFIVTHLMTNVEPRYFYPAVPLLYPYALFALKRGT